MKSLHLFKRIQWGSSKYTNPRKTLASKNKKFTISKKGLCWKTNFAVTCTRCVWFTWGTRHRLYWRWGWGSLLCWGSHRSHGWARGRVWLSNRGRVDSWGRTWASYRTCNTIRNVHYKCPYNYSTLINDSKINISRHEHSTCLPFLISGFGCRTSVKF